MSFVPADDEGGEVRVYKKDALIGEYTRQQFEEILKSNTTFKKLVQSLKQPDSYLMKYTSSLEETSKELNGKYVYLFWIIIICLVFHMSF